MVEQGGRGGVADYTAQLARALAAAGWEVSLATAHDHLYRPAPGVSLHGVFHYVRGGSRPARWVRRWRLGPLANGLRFLAALPRLGRLARQSDIVHVQGWEYTPLGLVATAWLRGTGTPVIQTAHNTFERGRSSLRGTHRALGMLAARTIVHSRADVERVAAAADRVTMIPHGNYTALALAGGSVDPAQARADLGLAGDTPVTLLFGQLRADKGLGDLLTAAAAVPRLHVLIAGEDTGALAAAEDGLQRGELAGRVTIREGFLAMPEAAKLFAAADTVTLPYRVASQSGVLLLAYAFRRPVVVYPVGGLIEAVVDGQTGWICERADPAALADALNASVTAGRVESRRRGEAGYRMAAERYSWRTIAERTERLYSEVLARAGASPTARARCRPRRRPR